MRFVYDSEYLGELKSYRESNIAVVGNILEKYYMYKRLGIKKCLFLKILFNENLYLIKDFCFCSIIYK